MSFHHRDNPPARQILWRQFQSDSIANQHPDEVASGAPGRVRDDLARSVNLDPVLRVWQRFSYDPFDRQGALPGVAGILLEHPSGYAAGAETLRRVSTSGPVFVTATVCSK